MEKKQPAIIFTENEAYVTTWSGCPAIPGEVERLNTSRSFAAKMLRKARKEKREEKVGPPIGKDDGPTLQPYLT